MLWWLGFDTGHSNDIIPRFLTLAGFPTLNNYPNPTYKTIKYCKKECYGLARQAIDVVGTTK